ncbi:MAG: hypothetical protein KC657_17455 [Myxococcales bacterium]|nr:hypothetical protein [Myxococcales bacterium]
MAKRWTVAEAEAVLRGGEGDRGAVLRALPAGVDVPLVARVVVDLLDDNAWYCGRSCRALPAPFIRATLAALAERPELVWGTFVRAHVDGRRDIQEAWAEALEAVLDLNTTYAFGSKPQRAKLAKIASDPRGLAACRAAAASRSAEVPWTVLGVLVVDGHEASLDALIPTIGRAIADEDRSLDLLEDLRRHASPAALALLDTAAETLAGRRARSPVLELGRVLYGVDAPEELRFSFTLTSEEVAFDGLALVQAHVKVDSTAADPFRVSLSRRKECALAAWAMTDIDLGGARSDELQLGGTTLLELPEYLARAADRLRVRWRWDELAPRTRLRGERRKRLVQWLRGGA